MKMNENEPFEAVARVRALRFTNPHIKVLILGFQPLGLSGSPPGWFPDAHQQDFSILIRLNSLKFLLWSLHFLFSLPFQKLSSPSEIPCKKLNMATDFFYSNSHKTVEAISPLPWIWADFVTCFDQQDVAEVTSYDFQALASRSPEPSAFTLFEDCGHENKPICEDERDHMEKPSSPAITEPFTEAPDCEQSHPWPVDPPTTANTCRVRWTILAELCLNCQAKEQWQMSDILSP